MFDGWYLHTSPFFSGSFAETAAMTFPCARSRSLWASAPVCDRCANAGTSSRRAGGMFRFRCASEGPNRFGGFLSHGRTPINHTNFRWIFPYKPSIFGVPHLWNPPIFLCHQSCDVDVSEMLRAGRLTYIWANKNGVNVSKCSRHRASGCMYNIKIVDVRLPKTWKLWMDYNSASPRHHDGF